MRPLTSLFMASLLILTACPKDGDTGDITDADGDGYAAWEDCNDRDAMIYPDATESCDGRDNDCDGEIDEGATTTLYRDADLDGYGDADLETTGCEGTGGYSILGTDCDDENSEVHPDAEEWCDGLDNDCDDEVDEDLDYATWYADDDEDGYGDPNDDIEDCVQPSGYIEDSQDCDDTDDTVNPDADEYCDGFDNDCDGDVDENDALDAITFYPDADGDGYGDADDKGTASCASPSGYVVEDTDCDDTDAAINPGEDEVCDEDDTDEDCDGLSDDDDDSTDASSMTTWYADADGDSYGDTSSSTTSCEMPANTTTDDTDCDDSDAAVNPRATETCDGIDNDCDGDTDDDDSRVIGTSTWYADADGDTYGDASDSVDACDQPLGYVTDATDCDDDDASVWVDCGADTGDTGTAFTRDGTYEGDFEILVELTSKGISDTCTGTMTIDVDETASTQIDGTGACAFAGILGSLLGSQSGTLDGNITTDPDAEGNIYVGTLLADTWEGEFTDDDTLWGEMDGTGSYSGITYYFVGEFTVER